MRSLFGVMSTVLVLVLASMFVSCEPAQKQAIDSDRLNISPRHHEWADISYEGRTVKAFVVYPEAETPTTAVLLIHENRGLTDWVRGLADQIAEAGYLAIAPDLLSGAGPNGGKTSDFADRNAARDALYQLAPEQVTADLHAVANYVKALPACNGKLTVAGFCWGGRQTFAFATVREDLLAACVFYGTAPKDSSVMQTITAPVYGFYGGNDARVNSTIDKTAEQMAQFGKVYEPVTYEGAGHGFMRSGETAEAGSANREGRNAGWQRWMQILEALDD